MTDPFGPEDVPRNPPPATPMAPGTPPAQAPGTPPTQAPFQPPSVGARPPGYPSAGAPPPGMAPPGFPSAAGTPGTPAGQYAMGDARPYAGFGSRLGALLVDGIIGGIIATIVMVPLIAWVASTYETEPAGCDIDLDPNCQVSSGFVTNVIIAVLVYIVLMLLFVFFYHVRPVAKTGQTVGRKVLNIRVVDEESGQPPGMGRSLGRYLFATIISSNIFYLGYLWNLWDEKKQTWHDKVVNTIVVSE